MNKRKLSNKHEQDIADFFGGITQIASGAIPLVGMKGDVITSSTCIECKATEKDYYILKKKIVKKIEVEALKCNRIPLLAIRVQGRDYILCRAFDFFREFPLITVAHIAESHKILPHTLQLLDQSSNYVTFKIDGVYWLLSSLETFSDYIDCNQWLKNFGDFYRKEGCEFEGKNKG